MPGAAAPRAIEPMLSGAGHRCLSPTGRHRHVQTSLPADAAVQWQTCARAPGSRTRLDSIANRTPLCTATGTAIRRMCRPRRR